MARIKVGYIGGGSTRAPGTMASLIQHGNEFDGSEIALVDLDEERLAVVKRIAECMARNAGLDLTITATTNRQEGLAGCDAVLSSFRPGGFQARALDERIPLKHGVIGQETQGPGGFFMALRSIHVMRQIADDIATVCPTAWIFNYTNPVNVVAQAMNDFTDIPTVALCEGPIIFPEEIAEAAGLDPKLLCATMAGLNHNCWSTEHSYDGGDLLPVLSDAYDRRKNDPALGDDERRLLRLAITMESVPSSYFRYFYFRDDILRQQQASPRTRAEVILSSVPDYWQHYREQSESETPVLDPARSRGGINELELAIDAMSAHFNDTGAVLPVNVPNATTALPGFDEDTVVELWARVDAAGFHPRPQRPLPRAVRGLVGMLAEYQVLAARAAWEGDHRDGVRALASHPLVPSLAIAENLYAEMATAHAAYLPDRLVP